MRPENERVHHQDDPTTQDSADRTSNKRNLFQIQQMHFHFDNIVDNALQVVGVELLNHQQFSPKVTSDKSERGKEVWTRTITMISIFLRKAGESASYSNTTDFLNKFR
jgi:hypothetical protein